MKCKICDKRCNSISAIAKHYRSEHPNSMKRKVKHQKANLNDGRNLKNTGLNFCPVCGKKV